MPEIFKISWSLEVLGYLIFSGVFLGKNILLIFYIPQFGKFPEYAYINFGVKYLEYAWDTLHNFKCKISGICIGHSRKISRLWNFEYSMHIPEILHQKLCNVSQAYSRNFSRLWNFEFPMPLPEILH